MQYFMIFFLKSSFIFMIALEKLFNCVILGRLLVKF